MLYETMCYTGHTFGSAFSPAFFSAANAQPSRLAAAHRPY